MKYDIDSKEKNLRIVIIGYFLILLLSTITGGIGVSKLLGLVLIVAFYLLLKFKKIDNNTYCLLLFLFTLYSLVTIHGILCIFSTLVLMIFDIILFIYSE